MPEAITSTETTGTVPVSATRQAILAQMMSQQAAVETDSNASIASSDNASAVIVLPAKAFIKKDFQSAPRLGESASTLFKPLETPTAVQTGMASWYGDQFHGRRTSSGQRFDMHGYTAAHRTLPFGTKLRVTNLANGRSVMVTVNDRGPFGHGRIIDLSKAAARDIGLMSMGVARVSLAKMPKFSPKLSPKLLPKKLAMLPPSKLGY
jgi:rare lipoprotein A (peptidoglycan hydrolase)